MAARLQVNLHKLCREGDMEAIRTLVDQVEQGILAGMLGCRKGVLGFTPLHEAVASGHALVLNYLLEKTDHAHINTQSNAGYTPLHLAAGSGPRECVEVLLEHSADMMIKDEWGKTALQAAELNAKKSIIRLLKMEEILREVERDGEKLTENVISYLNEPRCLNRVLMIATCNDNHTCIGQLLLKGAQNLLECLKIAETQNKPKALALLLLAQAAISGNSEIVKKLFSGSKFRAESVYEKVFSGAQHALVGGTVSTVVPIEMARICGHMQVCRELLLRTHMYPDKQSIQWNGLKLDRLDYFLLWRMVWVKTLDLARNSLQILPIDIGDYFKQVILINLQYNELAAIPTSLLQLPNLESLDLSHNRLLEIPADATMWSSALKRIDLSFNKLHSLPGNVSAFALESLNLRHNCLQGVPLCICSFVHLVFLDIGDNPNVKSLPARMGRLSKLTHLGLTNLKNLNDPPRSVQKVAQDCIRYLNNKLLSYKSLHRMRVLILGEKNVGKTTLVRKLTGKSTLANAGVSITEWVLKVKKPIYVSLWDFDGLLPCTAHQCFMSSNSIYLLLFNLKEGIQGVQGLRSWLNTIAFRAPHSRVIIIGTHLDETQRENADLVLNAVGNLVPSCQCDLQVSVLPVGLKDGVNVDMLKTTIHDCASELKTPAGERLMGLKIPAGYFTLDKQMEAVQREVREGIKEPIMHFDDFQIMVHQMKLDNIYSEEELASAALFLTDLGSLVHYDVRSHNLHQVYFIDPQWLCRMISCLVSMENDLIHSGIFDCKNISKVLVKTFPWKYLEQFLTLLDHFGVAFPLDNKCLFIPSFLPKGRPKHFEVENAPVYCRNIVFQDGNTPPDFWGRLLSRAIKFVPQVHSATATGISSDKDSCPEFEDPFSLSMNSPALQSATAENQSAFVHDLIVNDASSPDCESFEVYDWQQDDKKPLLNISNSFLTVPSPVQWDVQEIRNVELEIWDTGLYCKNSKSLLFGIESLAGAAHSQQDVDQNGVVIVTSQNRQGKKVLVELVDLVLSIIREWYSILEPGISQKIPCLTCLIENYPKPYEFDLEQCHKEIANLNSTIQCRHSKNSHSVLLSELVPDFTCSYIDSKHLLGHSEIACKFSDEFVIGNGKHSTVFQGTYNGKLVAYKKYFFRGEKDYAKLRSEARCLSDLHHPCLISIIGVHVTPFLAIVSKLAPLGSLHTVILERKEPFPRLTIFRIVTQVATALSFLHSRGIIHNSVEASNVLLWTLDPASLCHCKLTGLSSSTHMTPVGACASLQETAKFIAPEVYHSSKREIFSVYSHKIDIFSFGMLLYQMIAQCINPYYNIPPSRIGSFLKEGMRPQLHDLHFTTHYHYLTELMKQCWEGNPVNRPSTLEIIKTVSLVQVQSIMCVCKFRNCSDFCLAIASGDTAQNELWLVYYKGQSVELKIYDLSSMITTDQIVLEHHQVGTQVCAVNCNGHIWVGSRDGSLISIFDVTSHELVHSINLQDHFVSCLSCESGQVVIGTMGGVCLFFSGDPKCTSDATKLQQIYISNDPIDGLAFTKSHIWVSHTRYIHFIHLQSHLLDGPICRTQERNACIGRLSLSHAGDIVWSAEYGGKLLTSWDASNQAHCFDIDTNKLLFKISAGCDSFITAMTPVLDTVWVGMATGHIMVLCKEELLAWYQPYREYIQFLSFVTVDEPSKYLVISGGSSFIPAAEIMSKERNVKPYCDDDNCALVVWEAYSAKTTCQMKLIENNSPVFFDTFNIARMMIYNGEFLDGTEIMQKKDNSHGLLSSSSSSAPLSSNMKHEDSMKIDEEQFEICLSRIEKMEITVTCPRPLNLWRLLSELQLKACLSASDCKLEYDKKPGEVLTLQSQQQFDEYLALPERPKLFLAPHLNEASVSNSVYIF